jgi:hypothetical protein
MPCLKVIALDSLVTSFKMHDTTFRKVKRFNRGESDCQYNNRIENEIQAIIFSSCRLLFR